jgi:hypothetical protein
LEIEGSASHKVSGIVVSLAAFGRVVVGFSVQPRALRRLAGADLRERIVFGKPHLNRVSDDLDRGVHTLRAIRAEPHVLGPVLACARSAAEIEIQAEELSLIMMTGSGATAIGTSGFGGHGTLRLVQMS